MRFPLTLLVATLPATLLAQGVVPPFQIAPTQQVTGLGNGAGAWSQLGEVRFSHLPGDPPNVFYCAAGCIGLQSSYGGVGGADIACGSYDVLTDTFTPNAEATALNTTLGDRGLSVHHAGLVAVYVTDTGGPAGSLILATRPATGQPWQAVGTVTVCTFSCGGNDPYTPALADYHGQMHLLWNEGLDIVMAPLDVNAVALSGAPVVIVRGSSAWPNYSANSPIPVNDPSGELIGLYHGMRMGVPFINAHHMSLDLDPATPSVLVHSPPNPPNLSSPDGFIAGRFFEPDLSVSNASPVMDRVWCTGGRAPVGGTMHIRMFSPPTAGPEVYLSLVAANTGFLPAGQPLPPLQGLLGIQLIGAWASTPILHTNANGEAVFSFPIPNVPSLSGVRLPVQSVTWESVSGALYLGNTASLVVE